MMVAGGRNRLQDRRDWQITVLIPCYNEAQRLPPTLAEIRQFDVLFPGVISEVLIVDDGSKDNTVERALSFSSKLPIRVERFVENRGKWAAVHHGLSCSRTDAVLMMDADGSASIWELRRMGLLLKDAFKNKSAIFGSRFMKGASIDGKSWARRVVSLGYRQFSRFWFWYATGRKSVDDMQCPWKLIFRSRLCHDVLVDGKGNELWRVDRFAGDIELACCVQSAIWDWPVLFQHKRGSKVPFGAMFSMANETVQVARRFRKMREMEWHMQEPEHVVEYHTVVQ